MKEQIIRCWFYSRDTSFAEVLGRALGPGYEICQGDMEDLQSMLQRRQNLDALLLDAFTSGSEGCSEILQAAKGFLKSSPAPPPIIVMVHDDEQDVVRTLIENGADETLAGPPDIRELRLVLQRAHRYHQVELDLVQSRASQQNPGQLGEMSGCSKNIQKVFEMARKVAACDVSVLITGETGTGKELLARAIHRLSQRAARPFVPFSCANLPEPLIDDELFGHEKGAFTGAISARQGRFEAADQGTVFLDEIADLAPGLQAKLLRVLQERSFERLGSNTPIATDVRIVCATHQNLEEMVQDGRFRMDLYFRLNVVQVRIPPLRERREDIPMLAQQFLDQYAREFGKQTRRLSQPALHALEEYSWPGNIRELENVIQRAVVLSEEEAIEPAHLPAKLHSGFVLSPASSLYEEEVQEFKRRLLLRTLRACKGNRTESARQLGVTRGCLHRLINNLSIHEEEQDLPLEDCREIGRLPVGPVRQ